MSLDAVKGMNIDQVIEYYGNHPQSRDRTFFMYYDEEGGFREVSFGRFLEMSLDYARMIDSLRRRQGREWDGRFHVGFYMQNTPEVLYAFGGCAFTNATLVGINNAQVGQRLATDIKNMDVNVLFVDEVEQPKSGRTFLESVMGAHRDHNLSPLYPEYVIARKRQQRNHPAQVATIGEMLEVGSGTDFSPTPLEQERAGVIIFTSGTTGTPKGIEVPWKKVFDVGVMSTTVLNYGEDDVYPRPVERRQAPFEKEIQRQQFCKGHRAGGSHRLEQCGRPGDVCVEHGWRRCRLCPPASENRDQHRNQRPQPKGLHPDLRAGYLH
ncbi:MAG: AMP-binding protein [Deltaproteobacteria bacterium]|nr:AMP-binding protein [Deltaproteobacteria bacterium]